MKVETAFSNIHRMNDSKTDRVICPNVRERKCKSRGRGKISKLGGQVFVATRSLKSRGKKDAKMREKKKQNKNTCHLKKEKDNPSQLRDTPKSRRASKQHGERRAHTCKIGKQPHFSSSRKKRKGRIPLKIR